MPLANFLLTERVLICVTCCRDQNAAADSYDNIPVFLHFSTSRVFVSSLHATAERAVELPQTTGQGDSSLGFGVRKPNPHTLSVSVQRLIGTNTTRIGSAYERMPDLRDGNF
jgi:hypothetical protein